MKIKNLLLGAGVTLLLTSLAIPGLAKTIQVGKVKFDIIEVMPVTITRNQFGIPVTSYTTKSPDGRYRLREVLPTLTQEGTATAPRTARPLYRLIEVVDKSDRKVKTVAVPIRFVGMNVTR